MFFKATLVFCVQSLLIKTISSQCLGNAALLNRGLLADNYGYLTNGANLALAPNTLAQSVLAPATLTSFNNIAASRGGAFTVSSTSPISPNGVIVVSENALEGALGVAGQLPFLGSVALEGGLPSAGAGAVAYSCGNGVVEILNEAPTLGLVSGSIGPAYSYGTSGIGLGSNLAGTGLSGANLAASGLVGANLAATGLAGTNVAAANLAGAGLAYNSLGLNARGLGSCGSLY